MPWDLVENRVEPGNLRIEQCGLSRSWLLMELPNWPQFKAKRCLPTRGDSIVISSRPHWCSTGRMRPRKKCRASQVRSRANQKIQAFREHQVFDIPRLKGLEADSVFLVGDFSQIAVSPYRNMAYRQAILGKQGDHRLYDTALGEKTLRLAYVAITRAKKHCYWFIEPAQPLKGGLISALAQMSFREPLFEESRAR